MKESIKNEDIVNDNIDEIPFIFKSEKLANNFLSIQQDNISKKYPLLAIVRVEKYHTDNYVVRGIYNNVLLHFYGNETTLLTDISNV